VEQDNDGVKLRLDGKVRQIALRVVGSGELIYTFQTQALEKRRLYTSIRLPRIHFA
jgi:hypothetical protein